MALYLKVKHDDEDEMMGPRKILYEQVNPRWEVCVTLSTVGFQQASFVNSIATTKVMHDTFMNYNCNLLCGPGMKQYYNISTNCNIYYSNTIQYGLKEISIYCTLQ